MYDWKNEIHIHYIIIHILVFGLIGIHFPQCVDFFGVNAIHKYGTYVWTPPSTPSVSTSSTSRSDSVRICVLINLESITWQQSAAATGHAVYKYVDQHTHIYTCMQIFTFHLYKYFLYWRIWPVCRRVCCFYFLLLGLTPQQRDRQRQQQQPRPRQQQRYQREQQCRPDEATARHFVLILQIYLFRSVRWQLKYRGPSWAAINAACFQKLLTVFQASHSYIHKLITHTHTSHT